MAKTASPAPNRLWWPEAATGVATAAIPGLLPARLLTRLTLGFSLALGFILYPPLGLAAIPAAFIFGRLMALDLTTYTLPNLYTVPLFAIGITHATVQGHLGSSGLAALILFVAAMLLRRFPGRVGVGEGDLKLLAALFAFLPLQAAVFSLAIGCVVWLPVAFARPRSAIPFGLPILLGWVVILRVPHLPNLVLSAIS